MNNRTYNRRKKKKEKEKTETREMSTWYNKNKRKGLVALIYDMNIRQTEAAYLSIYDDKEVDDDDKLKAERMERTETHPLKDHE